MGDFAPFAAVALLQDAEQLLHHVAQLAVEQAQDLGVQGLVAAGIAGQVGQIDGGAGHAEASEKAR